MMLSQKIPNLLSSEGATKEEVQSSEIFTPATWLDMASDEAVALANALMGEDRLDVMENWVSRLNTHEKLYQRAGTRE